jgi:hypothetical protein
MAGFVDGVDRGQSTLFPALLADYVGRGRTFHTAWATSGRASSRALARKLVALGASGARAFARAVVDVVGDLTQAGPGEAG